MGTTDTRRDLTYVKDTADAFIKASELDKIGPWNVGYGACTSVWTLTDHLRMAIGSKSIVSISSKMRPEASEVRSLRCDAGAFTKATGWKPEHTLAGGLNATVELWRERPMRGTEQVV